MFDWSGRGTLGAWIYYAFGIFAFAWMIVWPLRVLRRRGGQPGPRLGALRVVFEILLSVPFLFMLGMVLAGAMELLQRATGQELGRTELLDRISEARSSWRVYLVAILASTVGPIAEEIFFRGFLYHALRRWVGWPLAAVGQAVLFALAHSYGVQHTVLVGVIGLVLLFIYRLRGTLLAPILVHALFNAVAFAVSMMPAPYLGVRGDPEADRCLIEHVEPESPADEAGIEVGDYIVEFDGEPVANFAELRIRIRAGSVDARVTIVVERDGKRRTLGAVLGRPKE